MRPLFLAAVLVVLTSAGASAAAPLPSGFFSLSRVHVRPQGRSLSFSVALQHVAADDRPVLAWSLSSTGGSSCENTGYPGGTRSRDGLVFWDQEGPTFAWKNGGTGRCGGRVSAIAENQDEHCTATVAVTTKGTTSATPSCAVGGYAIGFATLPIPASVFRAFTRAEAQLRRPPRNPVLAEHQLERDLQEQKATLSVFPPVWFCSFQGTFTPIVALRADLEGGATAAARRDARAAAHALTCAPTPVQRAFASLAASGKPELTPLTATLTHYFPPVFGLNYDDLVNEFADETVALERAEAATAAGNSAAATGELASVARSARAISTSLDRYQAKIVSVENAHG